MPRNIEALTLGEEMKTLCKDAFSSSVDLLREKGRLEKVGFGKKTVVVYPFNSLLKDATVVIWSEEKLVNPKKITIKIDGRGELKITKKMHNGKVEFKEEMSQFANGDLRMIDEVGDYLRAVKQLRGKLENPVTAA
jgi:hypothetical protein